MKLIDKNKLIDAVTERHYSHASMRVIREQPEIEAVPIAWLKKKVDEYYDLGLDTVAKELNYIIADWEDEPARDFERRICEEWGVEYERI